MQTQDIDPKSSRLPPLSTHSKKNVRVRNLMALLVVVLLVSISAIVYSQLVQRQKNQGTAVNSSGKWEIVLKGYSVYSIVAAPSNPAVLYAAVTPSQGGSAPGSVPGSSGSAPGVAPGSTNSTVTTVQPTYTPPTYTILRSTDYGATWQNIGANAALAGSGSLTINPTNSNEVYVVSEPAIVSNNQPVVSVIKHTTDGGQTWQTITPKLIRSGSQSTTSWSISQLSMVGTHLLGLTWLQEALPKTNGVEPPYGLSLTRLITSADGGQTWTIVDQQFRAARLGVRSYAVDPTNANVAYLLMGSSIMPVMLVGSEPQTTPDVPVVPTGFNADLYKTIDGGKHWQLILRDLPFGAQVQLASGQSQTIYAGGSAGVMPMMANSSVSSETQTAPSTQIQGGFQLQMSSDGGLNWHTVAALPQETYAETWFVGTGGVVYVKISSGSANPVGSVTAVAGTVMPASTVGLPAPQQPNAVQNGSIFQVYDPVKNSWSELTSIDTYGTFFGVTAGGTKSGDLLWFVGSDNNQEALYRYIN